MTSKPKISSSSISCSAEPTDYRTPVGDEMELDANKYVDLLIE